MARLTPGSWLRLVVVPFMGFALLWWADRQATDMRELSGSTFESPDWWIILGWLLTMIASGVVFGLAAGAAGARMGRDNTGALVVVGIIPAAIVVYYFSVWAAGWLPLYINDVTAFLMTPATVTFASVAVGLITAALIGGRTTPA